MKSIVLTICLLVTNQTFGHADINKVFTAKKLQEFNWSRRQYYRQSALQIVCGRQKKLGLWPWACRPPRASECSFFISKIKSTDDLPPDQFSKHWDNSCRERLKRQEKILAYKLGQDFEYSP